MYHYLHVVVNYAGHCANREFAELPCTCPHCGNDVQPWRLAARSTRADDTSVEFAFQCPQPDCRRLFVGRYVLGPDNTFHLDDGRARRLQEQLLAVYA